MEDKKTASHVGVIIDGNRRFAKARGEKPWEGHRAGADKVEEFLKWCRELEIKEATIYALSTENLKRDPKEVEALFSLFKKWFKKFAKNKEVKEKGVRIRFIGDLSLVPEDVRKLAEQIESETKSHSNYKINFCFAYGGRIELVHAINKLLDEGKKRVTEQDVTDALWLSSEPDLIIRTGGKIRTSNFLPWQSVYSEWIFLDKMWPEITKQDLIDCIAKFNQVQRNFGK